MPTVTSYTNCPCCSSSSSSSRSSASRSSTSGNECCPGLSGSLLHIVIQAGAGCQCSTESVFTARYEVLGATGTFTLCDLGEVVFVVQCDTASWSVTATSASFGGDSVRLANAVACPGVFLTGELRVGLCHFSFVVTL